MLKTKTERLLALAVAFLAGCAVRLAVPVAHAGQPVQRWEYACTEPHNISGRWGADDVTSNANKFGAQGWEMAAYGGVGGADIWCFKRPVGAAAPAPVSTQ
jgi:hypothetical protein